MDNKNVDDALKSYFSLKASPDERLKARLVQKAHERAEKRSNILLCVSQAAMVLLIAAITAAAFIFASGTVMPVLILSGILAGNLISVLVVILISNKKPIRRIKK